AACVGLLGRAVGARLPSGAPQAERLRAVRGPRARIVVERMTTDTATLLAEAARLGPKAGSRFREANGVPRDAALVLYVGRLAPEKGVDDLVDAVTRPLPEGADVHPAL